jgi:CheY-like chemotaxis protein
MSLARILIVEDERLIARDIAMQLQDMGYTPLGPATTGEQAIEMAEQFRPQLVLMDVHLGSAMDGVEAALAIRARFDLPSVFVSAFEGAGTTERAKLAQPAGFLSKPFSTHDLRVAVEDALLAS